MLLLEMLAQTDRAAHFHTSIVCAFPNGDELVCEGECPGTIAFAPMGEGGFGYDPVFFVPELRKTLPAHGGGKDGPSRIAGRRCAPSSVGTRRRILKGNEINRN